MFFFLYFTAPLFVFQWLFDEAQMRADSVGAPVTKKQWDFIYDTGIALRASLDNVTAVFAPSCIGHAVLTKRDWLQIKINDISLADALRCWAQSRHRNNKDLVQRTSDSNKKLNNNRKRRKKHGRRMSERNEHQKPHREQQKHRRRNGNKKKLKNIGAIVSADLNNVSTTPASTTAMSDQLTYFSNFKSPGKKRNGTSSEMSKTRRRKNNASNHSEQNNYHKQNQDQYTHHHQSAEPLSSRCSLRLLERCTWPQCNHSCPSITNPLTGKEMRFLELLASFGLDIEAVAAALGVDMTTLSNMDRTELLNLLTQSS